MPTIHNGDCIEVLATLPDASVDAIVTDPPYGLSNTDPGSVADTITKWASGDRGHVPTGRGFMGKSWDAFVPPPAVWDECMRVLKPGGHMVVFAGSRTQDLMGLSIRLAGFELRESLAWLYGCLSEDTEVLINGEWVQYHRAKVGDLALCYNKEHDTYEWQPIEDTHKYEYGDTAYRIHSNNTDQIVSRNHRVLVERGGAYEFEYAENLARERQVRVPILESLPTLLDDLSVREPLPGGEEPILRRELRRVRPSTGCGETDRATRNGGDCVCGMRNESLQAERLAEESGNPNMLTRVQREVARGGMEGARPQGLRRVDGRVAGFSQRKDERPEQSGLEGRGHLKEGARELQGCSVCEVPTRVSEHGTEGRVCDGTPSSGGASYRASFIANRSGAPCESQAGGQSVGEPVSVRVEPGSQAVRGTRHTVADLAEIEPVHYEGVVWCLTVPTGAFVVRRNGKVFVTGNSGFPKSHDVSKAIDKAAGVKREVIGSKIGQPGYHLKPGGKAGEAYGSGINGHTADERLAASQITAPATPEAAQWDGWGTALKPAFEPVVLARKPLAEKTVAGNVLAHGTGAINVDACRIATEDTLSFGSRKIGTDSGIYGTQEPKGEGKQHAHGRWPANVLLDHHAAAWVDEQSGITQSPTSTGRGAGGQNGMYSPIGGQGTVPAPGDQGGASRFFYTAKAPKRERPSYTTEDGQTVQHSTVKPLAIMRWLLRLVTPPGGTVLDPFAGSGTTIEAALIEGFNPIGIEMEADYLPLIQQRIDRQAAQLGI